MWLVELALCGSAEAKQFWRLNRLAGGRTPSMTIDRTVPNIRSDRPAETRDFLVELLGFNV